MSRVVRLPFAYEVEVRLPRKRGFEPLAVKGFADVRLEDPGPGGAPLAYVLRDAGAEDPVRASGGRLFRPVRAEDGGAVDAAGFEEIAALPAIEHRLRSPSRRWWPVADLPAPSGPCPVGLPTLEEALEPYAPREGVRIAGDDSGRRMAEAVACLCDGLILVGDEVWTSRGCVEPHWSVEFDPSGPSFSLRLRRSETPGAATFSLLRHDDALRYAREVALAHLGPRSTVTGAPGDVEVVRPDLVTRDDIVSLAVGVRAALLGPRGLRHWELRPGALPGSLREACVDLMDAAEAAAALPSRAESLLILRRLADFHRACEEATALPPAVDAPRLLTLGAVRRYGFEAERGIAHEERDPSDEAALGGLGL